MKTYNLKEAASYLRISYDHMRDLAAKGKVRGAKIGKPWVFIEDDLNKFINSEIKQQTDKRLQPITGEVKSTCNAPVRRRRQCKTPPALPTQSS